MENCRIAHNTVASISILSPALLSLSHCELLSEKNKFWEFYENHEDGIQIVARNCVGDQMSVGFLGSHSFLNENNEILALDDNLEEGCNDNDS